MVDFLRELSKTKLGTIANFNGKRYMNVTHMVIECLEDGKLFMKCFDF